MTDLRAVGGAVAQVVDAVYVDGVLRPAGELHLVEHQKVRLIVQPVREDQIGDRSAAVARLRAGIASMKFVLRGPLPSRDELHDRL